MDTDLNSRTVGIIRTLVTSPTAIGLARLSERLDCTPRMIRYCLPKAEAWLASRGARVERVRPYGFRLVANASLRQRLLSELQNQSPHALKLSVDQRLSVLSYLLMSTKGCRTIDELARATGVSRTTVRKDLNLLSSNISAKYGPRVGGRARKDQVAVEEGVD
ncbi:MAG TPA: HTH domain-containing protein [Firmicutes bacterium]|nr:HTH domain-containing protein [Candidatus Fermentithermobacillaceae bacterium]